LHLDGKTRTPGVAFGSDQGEDILTFRFGELLSGVIDKSSIGNSTLGAMTSVRTSSLPLLITDLKYYTLSYDDFQFMI
jgi:hypothetical protein